MPVTLAFCADHSLDSQDYQFQISGED